MILDPEELQQIEEFGGLFFSSDEIATIMGVDRFDLETALQDERHAGFQAYQRGKLRAKAELRKSILTLAKQGSGPAQTLALRLLDDLEAREL